MKKINKKERDFLLIIYGYLKGASLLKKTPSSLLIELKERILERQEFNLQVMERNRSNYDYYQNSDNFTDNNQNYKNNLMEGYNDDIDPDQQHPDFWS